MIILKSLKLVLYRKMRAARFSREFHRHNGYGFFRFGMASPTEHKWWAFELCLEWRESV